MIRIHILAGTMAVFLAGPALAQEDALPETTGAIPEEQLPEIGQGTLGGGIDASQLERLTAHSTAAQQFGNLAATKATSSLVGDLGDVMVLLHSQINDRLKEGPDPDAGAMDEADQERLNELSLLNEAEFATGLAQWITTAYPEIIEDWREVGATGPLDPLAGAVIPQLEGQLAVAEKILQADGRLASPDDQVRETLSWGGADEEGRVAEQFRIDPARDADGAEKQGE